MKELQAALIRLTKDLIWEKSNGQSIGIVAKRTTRPGSFGTAGTNGSYVQLLRKNTEGSIGGAKLLKVMSGDRIHTQVDYYYTSTNTDNSPANGINSLLASFATALGNSAQVSQIIKDGASTLTSALSSNTALVNMLNTPNNVSGAN